ncbi:hypothetical protein Kpol_1037p19 [Vanderwaltozyma polyspora DSM 70294]|uniref:DNA topoisomerase I n=1 Tax=Vanderwaltozyma polyspora (strain ATCC 22028 / DSM 70294 / BCRC 21397 / CBS 2163 / NBRC 10782 / NRRL Y-8283 / UCD 57-17) TaxID=436907 RepID=A7TJW1_VANPO|nr:uncharacterized protein Kpol_1037p19 [Vanderwaltozyma polyspora DSM 70294]EDO17423.1 hypothetical protein Kpol_1037p19 [Vanderwaltozyma polyspora DSM 70294]
MTVERKKKTQSKKTNGKIKKPLDDNSSDDDDIPLSRSSKRESKSTLKSNKRRIKVEDDEEEEDEVDSDTTLSQMSENGKNDSKSKSKPKPKSKSKQSKRLKTEDNSKTIVKPESPKKKQVEKISTKKENGNTSNTNSESNSNSNDEDGIADDDEDEEAEEYKWWEDNDDNGEIQWTTLRHNGVMFPPPYVSLPSHIKLYYNGQAVDLPPTAEEVAGFFAALLHTDHAKNTVFQKNFFTDFKEVLKEVGGTLNGIKLEKFEYCDFSKMHEYFEIQREQRKKLSPQEKKQLRLEKEEQEEPFKFCELDGRREQVGNFRVEPPDLFRGRGAHPKTGKLKRRVYPEDIVLNLDRNAPIPAVPEGHKWGEIKHDNTVQWLAMWRENISNSFKYVRLAANSSLKGQSDFKKFEKARELKKYIDSIRKDYRTNLKSKLMLERQKAVAIYLIDVFALRAGGEKSDDEADTVGCCSLRYEHVTLKPPNTVIFDFLGKDSIRFYQEVEVDKQVFKNLAIFKRAPKKPGDQLFDRLDPPILNKHLQNYMPGLTAKVFRTYNASKTMQDQLDLIVNKGSVAEKMLRYNAANRTVAILCNHQRSVGKGHAEAVRKANEKIEELEWQKIRLKRAILQLEPKEMKKRPKFFAEIGDLTKEDEESIHKRIIEREIERCHRKFQRENDKRKFDNEELIKEEELKEWLDKVSETEKKYSLEVETGEVEIKSTLNTVEKLEKNIEKLEQRIQTSSIQLKDKEENSQVSLGTSKINYIDPRLSVVFCKKFDIPIEKIFTKSLREKFRWAIESVDENWRF